MNLNTKVSMDRLWKYTQTPDLHEQWDLRFTKIHYLPKSDEDAPQRFSYTTHIGFGLRIAGEGESVGNKEQDGARTSSLKFSSQQSLSLIREGGGFWRYVPTANGIQFLTRYDYTTRFGIVGAWLDQWVFRPLMGWATAWSFDCLRLWLEQGIRPQESIRRAVTEALISFCLCFIWVYQGLVPKLMYPDSGELELLQSVVGGVKNIQQWLAWAGCAEIGFGLMFILLRGAARRWLHRINILLLVLLALSAATHPVSYVAPFNPITLNTAMIILSSVSLLHKQELPSAARCLRQPTGGRHTR